MNRYSGPPSKATASTLCQKCLKRGHYTYECTISAQARPYVSRPSRTQQLSNPRLVPELTSTVPNDLLRKKGVADEQLTRIAEERGRKHEREGSVSRSGSSGSSTSVSSISTNRSKSPSPPPPRRSSHKYRDNTQPETGGRHHQSREMRHHEGDAQEYRRIRRRVGSSSPSSRGRRRTRSMSEEEKSAGSRAGAPIRSRSAQRNRNAQPPEEPRRTRGYGGSERDTQDPASHRTGHRPRSLSPFSRRLALTQAMNGR